MTKLSDADILKCLHMAKSVFRGGTPNATDFQFELSRLKRPYPNTREGIVDLLLKMKNRGYIELIGNDYNTKYRVLSLKERIAKQRETNNG